MENASKALLIAGSVLIVIVLIAFGMRIFNSTTGTGEQVEDTMKAAEIEMFNNKFTPYIGTNKTKAQVISLLNAAIVNNSTNIQKISIDDTADIISFKTSINNLANNLVYKIEIDSYTKEGYIQMIDVAWYDESTQKWKDIIIDN